LEKQKVKFNPVSVFFEYEGLAMMMLVLSLSAFGELKVL